MANKPEFSDQEKIFIASLESNLRRTFFATSYLIVVIGIAVWGITVSSTALMGIALTIAVLGRLQELGIDNQNVQTVRDIIGKYEASFDSDEESEQ